MERGEAVGRECPDSLGILVESRAQPVEVAEPGGIEDVHRRIGGQEHIEHRPVEPVARMQERRDTVRIASAGQGRIPLHDRGNGRRVAGIDRGEQVVRAGG